MAGIPVLQSRHRAPRRGAFPAKGGPTVLRIASVFAFGASAALAVPIPKGDLTIELETVASGLVAPVSVVHAGDGSGRLFIVEQSGQIRIVQNGILLPTAFLDISSKLPALNAFFDERGLLGLAFHPDYASNGRFFVRYSAPRDGEPDEPCFGSSRGCHSEVLAEYAVSAGDPNVADPGSELILLSVEEPQFNHNSGEVAFGPDGFLYFTLGDGGGAHDGLADMPPSHGPIGNGQNIETILGSMLRIDVDNGSSLRALRAMLDGDQANAGMGTGSPHTGLAVMTLNEDTNEFCMDLTFTGLVGNQTVQHVHGPAMPGQNAGVMFGLPGPGDFAAFCTVVSDAHEQIILDGLSYVNIHSDVNPGGEIRGQIIPVYSIPPDNPFASGPGADEIYAYGMRNPFKFSFDDGPGGTGELFVADVGQNLFEEVNIVENGGNYGWVIREGLHCFDPFDPANPPAVCSSTGPMGEPLIDPIVEYAHPARGFDPEGGITVIGGFVYRGSRSPGLAGRYVFGDFAQQFVVPSGSLYFLEEPAPGSFEIRQFQIGLDDRPYGLFLKGFGEGEDGEVYACGSTALAPFGTSGVVQRIVEVRDAAVDIKPGACPNPLNRGSHGVVPVAILGSDTFDATNVDIASVRLSRDGLGTGLTASIDGAQENPPVATAASGTATFRLNAAGTALDYLIQLNGLDLDGAQTPDPDDNVTRMHIHNAPAGVNGGVIFGMISPGHDADDIVIDPVAGTVSGTWEDTDPANGLLSDFVDELLAGEMYVNVHTPVHPGGEIRGQIFVDPDATSVAPNQGPPGPGASIADVGTPFDGEPCACHDLDGDDVADLVLKFRTDDLVEALSLNDLSSGALVELTLAGELLDGSPFVGSDCVRLIPPGTPPGMVAVQSNVSGAWIGVTPPDLQLDSGGFADFERTFPMTTVTTLSAQSPHEGRRFVGWKVDGAFATTEASIEVEVNSDVRTLTAILLRPGDMNGDDQVDLIDFAQFAVCYGVVSGGGGACTLEAQAAADFNGDARVDLSDFATLATNFGP